MHADVCANGPLGVDDDVIRPTYKHNDLMLGNIRSTFPQWLGDGVNDDGYAAGGRMAAPMQEDPADPEIQRPLSYLKYRYDGETEYAPHTSLSPNAKRTSTMSICVCARASAFWSPLVSLHSLYFCISPAHVRTRTYTRTYTRTHAHTRTHTFVGMLWRVPLKPDSVNSMPMTS